MRYLNSLFLIICIFSPGVFAQSAASLALEITDQNGALISVYTLKIKQSEKVIKEFSSELPVERLILDELLPGEVRLEIEAEGFEPFSQTFTLEPGERKLLQIKLTLAKITETVEVESSPQEKAVDTAFSNFLTPEEIAALPDDPAELKKVLRQMAGDENAVIRVDGFSSSGVPPKSEIASVRIVRSAFDAEYHEIGNTYIEITTRAGNAKFSSSVSFNFNDESLNARNPFAPERFPEQTLNGVLFLSGPIKKDKASFTFLAIGGRNSEGSSINAILPNGRFFDFAKTTNDSILISPKINYNLSANHAARIQYDFFDSRSENLGVGDFDLASRGYELKTRRHALRISESGIVAKRYLNEFRFQFLNETRQINPQSSDAAEIVLGFFNRGSSNNETDFNKTSFMVADNVLFGIQDHALKIGVMAEYEKLREKSRFNSNGTFTFSNLENFLLDNPSTYTRNLSTEEIEISNFKFAAFIQDDFRLRTNLNISLGFRYEVQTNLNDYNNFSPRIGITYSPFKKGRTTIRAGAGIFYNWLESESLSTIRRNDIFQTEQLVIINPGFPDPFAGGRSEILPLNFYKLAEDLKSPKVFHTSLAVQQKISRQLSLRAKYVYEKGYNQFRSRNINAPVFIGGGGVRPNPEFGNINRVESTAFFLRNSLDVGLSGSITRQVTFFSKYTLSKIISDADGIFYLPSDNYDLRADRSVSNLDRRHRLSTLVSWQIIKGVRLTGSHFLNSPLPYSITTGFDDNNDTNFNDRPIGTNRNSERGTWTNRFDLGLSWFFSFINKDAQDGDGRSYSVLTTASESNAGFDFTDPKKRFSLKFYANIENLFNTSNFNRFSGVQTSPLFRLPLNADNPRRINVGLRFNF